jgi:hypothetical protein
MSEVARRRAAFELTACYGARSGPRAQAAKRRTTDACQYATFPVSTLNFPERHLRNEYVVRLRPFLRAIAPSRWPSTLHNVLRGRGHQGPYVTAC